MPGDPELLASASQPEPAVASKVAFPLGSRYALRQEPGVVMPLQQQASKAREVVLVLLPVDVSHPVEPFKITPAQPIAVLTGSAALTSK